MKMFEKDINSCASPPFSHESSLNKENISPNKVEVCMLPCQEFDWSQPLPNVVDMDDNDYEPVQIEPKKPVFVPMLYEESSTECEYITDEMIDIGGKILTQIACTNLSYSTYRPSADVKPAVIESHTCPVCGKQRELVELSQYFMKSGMSDLNDIVSGQPITIGNACGNAVFEAQRTMESHIVNILQNARSSLHLRPTELVLAISYFDRLFKQHWACSTFILFRQSIRSVFVGCLLIAHKMSSDSPYQNSYWAQVFNLELAALNEFERTVLILLEHNMGFVGDEGIEKYHGWRCLIDRENRFW